MLVRQARAAMNAGQLGRALRLAARSINIQPSVAAYTVMAKTNCMKMDIGNLRAALRNIPGRRHRRAIWRFCKKYGLEAAD